MIVDCPCGGDASPRGAIFARVVILTVAVIVYISSAQVSPEKSTAQAPHVVCTLDGRIAHLPLPHFRGKGGSVLSQREMYITKNGRPFSFSPARILQTADCLEIMHVTDTDSGNYSFLHLANNKTAFIELLVLSPTKFYECPVHLPFLHMPKEHLVAANGPSTATFLKPHLTKFLSEESAVKHMSFQWYSSRLGRLTDSGWVNGTQAPFLYLRGENISDTYWLTVSYRSQNITQGRWWNVSTTVLVTVARKQNVTAAAFPTSPSPLPTTVHLQSPTTPTAPLPASTNHSPTADQPQTNPTTQLPSPVYTKTETPSTSEQEPSSANNPGSQESSDEMTLTVLVVMIILFVIVTASIVLILCIFLKRQRKKKKQKPVNEEIVMATLRAQMESMPPVPEPWKNVINNGRLRTELSIRLKPEDLGRGAEEEGFLNHNEGELQSILSVHADDDRTKTDKILDRLMPLPLQVGSDRDDSERNGYDALKRILLRYPEYHDLLKQIFRREEDFLSDNQPESTEDRVNHLTNGSIPVHAREQDTRSSNVS